MAADGFYEESDAFMEALKTKWLPRLADDTDGDRIRIAEMLRAWYQRQRPKDWDRPKGKNVEKVKAIKEALAAGERRTTS